MVVTVGGVYEIAITASGVDKAGNAIQVELTVYAVYAADAGAAVTAAEAGVLKEPVIPDGAGAFLTPQQVTATSVAAAGFLPVSNLMYRLETSGAVARFPVHHLQEVQVSAASGKESVVTVTVYGLNTTLSQAISLATSHVRSMRVVPDTETQELHQPDSVVALSGKSIKSVPTPWSQTFLQP